MIEDNINYEYILRYLRDVTQEPRPFLEELRRYAEEKDIPIAQPETMAFLHFLCHIVQPKRILEIGSAIGYSALSMATACSAQITTLEKEETLCEYAKQEIAKQGYSHRIQVICGDALETISSLSEPFDFVFVDAAKSQYEEFYRLLLPLWKKGGVMVCDNVLYKGMTATDELVVRRKITIVKRLRKFLAERMQDDTLETSLLPVGDGILLAYRK